MPALDRRGKLHFTNKKIRYFSIKLRKKKYSDLKTAFQECINSIENIKISDKNKKKSTNNTGGKQTHHKNTLKYNLKKT